MYTIPYSSFLSSPSPFSHLPLILTHTSPVQRTQRSPRSARPRRYHPRLNQRRISDTYQQSEFIACGARLYLGADSIPPTRHSTGGKSFVADQPTSNCSSLTVNLPLLPIHDSASLYNFPIILCIVYICPLSQTTIFELDLHLFTQKKGLARMRHNHNASFA